MLRFLGFSALLLVFFTAAPALAFQLGTYTCEVESQNSILPGPNGTPLTGLSAPDIKQFTVKLEPHRAPEKCKAQWGEQKHPHECHSTHMATFNPPIVPDEAVLFGLKDKEPDVYFGKSSYVHFTDNITFQASWSSYGTLAIAKGRCARANTTNN